MIDCRALAVFLEVVMYQPNKLKVYEVPYDSNCDIWKLLRTIRIVAKKT